MQTNNTRITLLKRALLANNVVFALSLVLIWTLAVPTPAQAYVDPSVMTYTIQALAGVAVALSAVAGIAFRRSRKLILKALHIEEKRVTEPVVSSITPDQKATVDAAAKTALATSILSQNNGAAPLDGEDSAKWTTRLVAALCVSFFFAFTFLIVAPYEIIAGNAASLVFSISQVWWVFILPALLVTAVSTAVLTLLRKRVFNLFLMLVFGFTLACYVQVLFLNIGLPTSTGATIAWSDYTKVSCFTFVVWTLVFIAPFALSQLNRNLARKVVSIVSVALILVQLVGVGSIFVKDHVGASDEDKAEYTVTEKGMFTVSPKKNTVIFVLDMYDTPMDLIPLAKSNPALLQEMTGFTWFQNVTSVITPTRDAVPAILTGYQPNHNANLDKMAWDRWDYTDFMGDLTKAGYDIGIYSENVNPQVKQINKNVMNVLPSDKVADNSPKLNVKGTLKAIYECALFRDLPWPFKPFFWFYTDDVNNAMIKRTDPAQSAVYDDTIPYTTNDPLYFQKLKNVRLSFADENKEGSFRFIHLLGPHWPNTMDENGVDIGQSTRAQQATGSMNIVSEYIRQLKKLGIYDQTTIMIISDHGYMSGTGNLDLTTFAANPIFLVKPAQSAQADAEPCKISQAPISLLDVMPTALTASGVSMTRQGDGMNAFDVTDANRQRFFAMLSRNSSGFEYGVVEYSIVGDANDFTNWKPTGWVMHYPRNEASWWEDRGSRTVG